MDDQEDIGDVVDALKKWAHDQGKEVLEGSDHLGEIERQFIIPSLKQVVDEELPRIIEADPGFFEKHGIVLPTNQEVHLFDLYYDRHREEGMKRVIHSAKVRFRHLRFFLVDHPDRGELNQTIIAYKKILDGSYFNEPC